MNVIIFSFILWDDEFQNNDVVSIEEIKGRTEEQKNRRTEEQKRREKLRSEINYVYNNNSLKRFKGMK